MDGKKTKGFTLLEVLFALFLVSIAVVFYYPHLHTTIKLQEKAILENKVLDDLENSIEYLKNKDYIDNNILSEGSTADVRIENQGDFKKVKVVVRNGEVIKHAEFFKIK